MVRRLSLLIVFFVNSCILFAQDPDFAQPYANPVYLNPAYAGALGGLRIVANHRDQWARIPGTFTTTSLSVDVTEPCMSSGIAFTAMRDVEGEGFLNTSKAGMVYQFNWLANRRKRTYFATAIGASVGSMSIDWDKLEFSDQFHPIKGKQPFPSGAVRPDNIKRNFVDFDAGFIVNHKFYYKHSKDENLLTGGIAIHHLYQAGQTIMGSDKVNFMPRRYTLHGGANLGIRNNKGIRGGYVFPHFSVNFQPINNVTPAFSDVTLGLHAFRNPFLLGIAYQNAETPLHLKNTNAIALIAGFQQPFKDNSTSYQITYSYDVNLSGLSFSTSGSHEISLILFFDSKSVICSATGGGKTIKESNCLKVRRSGFLSPF